jgi:hypothetical protein
MDTLTVTLTLLLGAFLVSLPILKMFKAPENIEKPVFKDTPETLDPVTLPVIGQLPSWVNGTLFRVGMASSTISFLFSKV